MEELAYAYRMLLQPVRLAHLHPAWLYWTVQDQRSMDIPVRRVRGQATIRPSETRQIPRMRNGWHCPTAVRKGFALFGGTLRLLRVNRLRLHPRFQRQQAHRRKTRGREVPRPQGETDLGRASSSSQLHAHPFLGPFRPSVTTNLLSSVSPAIFEATDVNAIACRGPTKIQTKTKIQTNKLRVKPLASAGDKPSARQVY